jgi:hypothetical protein
MFRKYHPSLGTSATVCGLAIAAVLSTSLMDGPSSQLAAEPRLHVRVKSGEVCNFFKESDVVRGSYGGWDIGVSSDGNRIVVSFPYVIDFRRRIASRLHGAGKACVFSDSRGAAISPCGAVALYAEDETGFSCWDVEKGLRLEYIFTPSSVVRLRFSRSGKFLAARCGNGQCLLYEWPSKRLLYSVTDRGGITCSIDVSDDGRYLITGCHGDPAVLWRVPAKEPYHSKIGPPESSCFVTISRSGFMAAYGSLTTKRIVVLETVTGRIRMEMKCSICPRRLTFTSDARLLVVSGKDGVAIVDLMHGAEMLVIEMVKEKDAIAEVVPETDDLILFLDHCYRIPATSYLRRWRDRKLSPAPEELDRAWEDLASPDATKAFHACKLFLSNTEQVLAYLSTKLQAGKAEFDEISKRIAGYVEALGAADPQQREKATEKLRELDWHALVMLERYANHPDPEIRRRVKLLMVDLEHKCKLRFLRVIEILEHLSLPKAIATLQELACAAEGTSLGVEVRAALDRLAMRKTALDKSVEQRADP